VSLSLKDTFISSSACGTLPLGLKSGLVGWWPFCGNANDESGNGNNGSNNGATLTKDRFGVLKSAYFFDGINDVIRVPDNTNLRLLSGDFTISLWYKVKNYGLPNRMFIIKSDGPGATNKWVVQKNAVINGGPSLGFHTNGGLGSYSVTASTKEDTIWHNMIVRHKGTTFEIYEDGVLLTSSTVLKMQTSAADIRIGGDEISGGGHWHHGSLDDIGIWNRALSASEIAALYQAQTATGPDYTWSTGDTTTRTRIQTTGTTKVWVSSNNGISTCYDTTTVGISNPKVNIAPDTLRFTTCSRDSMKVSVGKGWKSVAWSTGAKDTSIQLKTTGTYAVKVQDNVGCYAYDTTYFINPGKVKVTVISIDSVNCYNGADGSISSSNTGGFAPVTLAWNDPSKQNTSKATGLKAGTYKLMATDAYGCKDSATATVLQPAQLTITVSSIDSIRCYRYTDGSITVTATGGTQPYAYGWNTGSKTTKADKLGAGTYKVVIQDANGCKDSLTATLQDPPELIARIVSGTMALKGEKLNVSGIATPAGGHTYSWQPATLFGSMSGSQNASISLEKNVTLRLTVTNKNNCISRDSLDITVVQALKDIMPNAFSPNTDGLNEGFGLPDIFEIQEFYVYDRWGGIVFKGNASTPRWDGNIGGVAAPAGSYSYSIVATLKGGTQALQYSGKVSLIK
jgi:gliding motility-associated-like protein